LPSTAPLQLHLNDERATEALGAAFASCLVPGLLVFLRGDLGAGKTTFTRALVRALGYTGRVKSPTYTLVELYALSSLSLYHFDFYRFNDPQEWLDAGFDEVFGTNAVCIVEWPERAQDLMPVPDLEIALMPGENGRDVDITARTERGEQCLAGLKYHPPTA
jgi:tRNA threonylcarbamoyladenosine biosynthesis protein TsaE